MPDRPSAAVFLTGWTVQNVNIDDATKAASLAVACIADAEKRGIAAEELKAAADGNLQAFMQREIAAFTAAQPVRELSRDD